MDRANRLKRKERLLSGIDIRNSVGLEIGPLCWPLVEKSEGEIIYVDFADLATLREKYRDDPNVDVDRIVAPDALWGANSLQQAIGEHRKVDYVVASHVIEHVPDLITWLTELNSILKDGGQIRLAVPDRRFTFDYLRTESGLPEVLHCYLVRARAPQAFSILDFFLNFALIDCVKAWNGEIDPANVKRHISFEAAFEAAREAVATGKYRDVHCWAFTPRSFADLFAQLAEQGFIPFACERFYDTQRYEDEFFVSLQLSSDKAGMVESWRRMADVCGRRPSTPKNEVRTGMVLRPPDIDPAERERLARLLTVPLN